LEKTGFRNLEIMEKNVVNLAVVSKNLAVGVVAAIKVNPYVIRIGQTSAKQ
jgi:hypothetical protein